MATIQILKKINGVTTDSDITINTCYIYLTVDTTQLISNGVINIDYRCYTSIENQSNTNIKPFKLLKADGTRVTNITGFTPTAIITQDNYGEQCKLAFMETFGWTDANVIVETITE